MDNLFREEDTYKIIGAAMEVYNQYGHGIHETIYQEALSIELGLRDIAWEREREVIIYYKTYRLNKKYKLDFVACKDIIVETKTLPQLTSKEESQLINYLRITKMELGLLINFGNPGRLEWKRIINRSSNGVNPTR